MPSTATPLFATPCLGETIGHVEVFPTHIRYEQKLWKDIFVPLSTIASVERHAYEHGFVILSTTSRRRIICTVHRKHVERLYTAIRNAQRRGERAGTTLNHLSGFRAKKPLRNPTTTTAVLNAKRVEHGRRSQPPIFPPKEFKPSRA
jgi:hypothetical protein